MYRALPIDTQKKMANCLKTSRFVQYTQIFHKINTVAQKHREMQLYSDYSPQDLKQLGTSLTTVFISLKHCKNAKGKVN